MSSMKKAFIDAAFAALECDNLLSLSSPGINSRRMQSGKKRRCANQSGVEPPHSKALRASHIDCLPNESHSLPSEVVTSFSGLHPRKIRYKKTGPGFAGARLFVT